MSNNNALFGFQPVEKLQNVSDYTPSKSKEDCINWVDSLISRYPNVGDINYLRSIKKYLQE